MNSVFKSLLIIAFFGLAACEGGTSSPTNFFEGLGSPQAEIANEPVQGSIDGVAWKVSSAIAKVQPDGLLLITLAGNGETITCNYSQPLKPSLMFGVPKAVADHKFDMLRPEEGYAVTWFYSTPQLGPMNIFSDMATISIRSIEATRVTGGISAKFLDPSHTGKMNGTFEAVLCQ